VDRVVDADADGDGGDDRGHDIKGKPHRAHEAEVESWFNVIAPKDGTLELLRGNLQALTQKLTAQD
jgi:hypothetical protein